MFGKIIAAKYLTNRSYFLFSYETQKKKFFPTKVQEKQKRVYPLQYPNLKQNNQPIIPRSRPTRFITPRHEIQLDQLTQSDQRIKNNVYKGKWQSPKNAFTLSVGLIGPVNAGKSELLGKLAHRVSAVSPKAVTTDEKIESIKSFERDSEEGIKNIQLKYIDTPGVVAHKTGFISKGLKYLSDIDFALLIVDGAKRFDDVIKQTIKRIEKHRDYERFMKALILNKVDLVDNRRKFNTLISEIEKHGKFDKIFYISALTGHGVPELQEYLLGMAKPGQWEYPPETKTTLSQIQIYEQLLKQCLFHRLYKEVPHKFVIKCTSSCELTDGTLQLLFDVKVQSENQQRMLIGKKGKNMQNVIERFKSLVYKLQSKKTKVFVSVKILDSYNRKYPGREEFIIASDEIEDAKEKIKIIEQNLRIDKG